MCHPYTHILIWRRFGNESRRSKVNSLEDLPRFLPTLLTFKLITLVKPAISIFASISATENYAQDFQRCKRTQEYKRLNFTSNNEESYTH